MSDEPQPAPPSDESAPTPASASPEEAAAAPVVEGASAPAEAAAAHLEKAATEVEKAAPAVEKAEAEKPATEGETVEVAAAAKVETGATIDGSPVMVPGGAAPSALAVPSKDPSSTPSYVFLAVVSTTSLVLDLGSKWWAKTRLEDAKAFVDRHIEVIPNYLSFSFAKNKGGAWGLLQNEPETIRRPFFLGISVLAIVFIVSLYRRLTPQQTALKWGLPLVLGGALGNLVNRIQYNYVVDFIDAYYKTGHEEHHWPTFNIADVAICVGVGLMAVDMFTSRRTPAAPAMGTVAPTVALAASVEAPPAASEPEAAPPPAAEPKSSDGA